MWGKSAAEKCTCAYKGEDPTRVVLHTHLMEDPF